MDAGRLICHGFGGRDARKVKKKKLPFSVNLSRETNEKAGKENESRDDSSRENVKSERRDDRCEIVQS